MTCIFGTSSNTPITSASDRPRRLFTTDRTSPRRRIRQASRLRRRNRHSNAVKVMFVAYGDAQKTDPSLRSPQPLVRLWGFKLLRSTMTILIGTRDQSRSFASSDDIVFTQ